MELKVPDEQVVALPDEAEVQGQIIVGENSFTLVHGVNLVVDQVSLGH